MSKPILGSMSRVLVNEYEKTLLRFIVTCKQYPIFLLINPEICKWHCYDFSSRETRPLGSWKSIELMKHAYDIFEEECWFIWTLWNLSECLKFQIIFITRQWVTWNFLFFFANFWSITILSQRYPRLQTQIFQMYILWSFVGLWKPIELKNIQQTQIKQKRFRMGVTYAVPILLPTSGSSSGRKIT